MIPDKKEGVGMIIFVCEYDQRLVRSVQCKEGVIVNLYLANSSVLSRKPWILFGWSRDSILKVNNPMSGNLHVHYNRLRRETSDPTFPIRHC